MKIEAIVECPVFDSFRVRQVAGMFDLPPAERLAERFAVAVPDASEPWEIGVIVGPSGSGKTTVARRAFGDALCAAGEGWAADRAVIDGFGDRPTRDVVRALTAVGFSSPPAWVKPYPVLSNGERFRCDLARALLGGDGGSDGSLVAFDEFTSVVDRTVARIGSAAVAKAIRAGHIRRRFVAVTCHYDVIEWLCPDWVVDMATQALARGSLRRRPPIHLEVRRATAEAWGIFKRHHYLSGELHRSAACFVGYVEGRPATFAAALAFPHPTRPGWKEHRAVCLPDFQGVGLGNATSEFVASLYRASGRPYFSTTSHPAMIRHRCRSPLWRVTRRPEVMTRPHASRGMARAGSAGRLTAGFEYVGAAREAEARAFGVVGGVPGSRARRGPR